MLNFEVLPPQKDMYSNDKGAGEHSRRQECRRRATNRSPILREENAVDDAYDRSVGRNHAYCQTVAIALITLGAI